MKVNIASVKKFFSKVKDLWTRFKNFKAVIVFAFIVKWLYRLINFIIRQALLILILYSAAFTIAASYFMYKGFIYVYDLYDGVVSLKNDQPEMSKYMQALLDSNPSFEIKHTYVPLDSIHVNLRKAVIASEDAGFYFHPGFDIRAISEALEANRVSGKTKFGGSTITQQLAKNLFLSGERSWERKFKELAYALLMEHELGKDRILELYLNYAQWGKDIFGCQEACLTYYKKSCSKLSVDQAINLAAMLASPGKHHPNMRESQFMAKRRAVIYQNMFPKKDSLLVDSLRQLMAPRSSSSQALDAGTPVNAHDKPTKGGHSSAAKSQAPKDKAPKEKSAAKDSAAQKAKNKKK